MLRELCRHKGVELEEGNALPDHIHMLLSVPPKIQHSDDNRVFIIKECHSDPSSTHEKERDAVWALILGTRLLCKHSGPWWAPNQGVYQRARAVAKTTRAIRNKFRLMAPFRGLPHTTGLTGGRWLWHQHKGLRLKTNRWFFVLVFWAFRGVKLIVLSWC